MKKILFTVIILTISAVGIWLFVIPQHTIMNLMNSALSDTDLLLTGEGLQKDILFAVRAERMLLNNRSDSDDHSALLICENFYGRIPFLSLLRFDPSFTFDCTIGNGHVTGNINLISMTNFEFEGKTISFEDIGVLKKYGLHGKGKLSAGFSLSEGSGEIRFSVDDARLSSAVFDNFFPLSLFHKIAGLVAVEKGSANIRSLTLEGTGVHARIKGTIKDHFLNASLELMIESAFAANFPALKSIEQFKVSPGYYVMPLAATLSYTQTAH
jgi:type II secretion system protein N